MKILGNVTKKLTSFYNVVSGQFKKKQPITSQKEITFNNVDEILDYALKNNLKNQEIKILIENINNREKQVQTICIINVLKEMGINNTSKKTIKKRIINLLIKLKRSVQKIKTADCVTIFDEKTICQVSGVEKCAVLQWEDDDGEHHREWIPTKFLTRVYKSKP